MSGTYEHQRHYRAKLLKQPVPAGTKRCKRCLKVKPENDFVCQSPRTPDGVSKFCSECRNYSKAFMLQVRLEATEEEKQRISTRAKHLRDGRKKLVIEHYGGKCECCGESHLEFLTMDHKEKIGSKLRKANGEWGNRFYLTIIRRGFPQHLRVLCWNCNWSFGCYGYCPHQAAKAAVATV